MFGWFKKKSIEEKMQGIKKIKIHGIIFKIKRLDPLDCLTGAQVMLKTYQTYQEKRSSEKENQEISERLLKKIRSHYIDVIMAGTVEPKLTRKKDDDGIFVENLFTEFALASELYDAITVHTYGKKKIRSSISQNKS